MTSSVPSPCRRKLHIGLAAAALFAAPNLARAGSVSAGASHSGVVKTTDNTAWTWGLNTNGRLGDGTQTLRTLPVSLSLTNVTAVAAGGFHTLFLKSDGTVWSVGLNASGQLGDNSTTQRLSPVQVGVSGNWLTNVVGIAAGDTHSLAWKSDGTLWARSS